LTSDTRWYLIPSGIEYQAVSEVVMAHRHVRDGDDARREALAWLATQKLWEHRLAELRRPGGGRPASKRRPRPALPARQAS
jgi:hypothetical protein